MSSYCWCTLFLQMNVGWQVAEGALNEEHPVTQVLLMELKHVKVIMEEMHALSLALEMDPIARGHLNSGSVACSVHVV